MRCNHGTGSGFTLIEISIVLVIIGLLTGGVLAGRDLIEAAAVRAQMAQIQQYNTAVHTFKLKYDGLPGDLNSRLAARFGFTPRGTNAGEGDGNGVIEGINADARGSNLGWYVMAGETAMFWVDLTTANGLNVNLIPGSFSAARPTTLPAGDIGPEWHTSLSTYFPVAKAGNGNYVYVWSGGFQAALGGAGDGHNYFGVSAIVSSAYRDRIYSNPGLTVQQAYSIDKKIDDGMPSSGTVIAIWFSPDGRGTGPPYWSGPPSSTTCGDNGNGANGGNTPWTYSLANANLMNCALSFQFQ